MGKGVHLSQDIIILYLISFILLVFSDILPDFGIRYKRSSGSALLLQSGAFRVKFFTLQRYILTDGSFSVHGIYLHQSLLQFVLFCLDFVCLWQTFRFPCLSAWFVQVDFRFGFALHQHELRFVRANMRLRSTHRASWFFTGFRLYLLEAGLSFS